MHENARLIFSIIWLIASGCLFAALLAVIFTWGDYANFLYISLGVWCVASLGAIITSLS